MAAERRTRLNKIGFAWNAYMVRLLIDQQNRFVSLSPIFLGLAPHGGRTRIFDLIRSRTDLDQNARLAGADNGTMEWQPIVTAPFDRDLELAVINHDGPHALVFPCHRVFEGWVNAKTEKPVTVYPTHWRDWQQTLKDA